MGYRISKQNTAPAIESLPLFGISTVMFSQFREPEDRSGPNRARSLILSEQGLRTSAGPHWPSYPPGTVRLANFVSS